MRIPVTILSGYLGAGKTTLINHLLAVSQGTRITVLVNDFGAVNVDASLIAQRGTDTIALSNGCACCSIGDDLAAALDAQVRRADPPQRILVEASGVAEPARMQHYARSPGLRLEAVVTMVDASAIRSRARDKYVGRLVHRQIAAAHTVVMNKTDLIAAAEQADVRQWLAHVAPTARLAMAERGKVDPSLLMGVPLAGRNAGVTSDDATDLRFHSCAVAFPRPVEIADLQALLADAPKSVHRAKGFVRSMDGRLTLMQYSGADVTVEAMEDAASVVSTALVVIGPDAGELEAFTSKLRRLATGPIPHSSAFQRLPT